ncbi:MAG: ADP-ribosylglycohydrolase family protein [Fibrobacteria bacterium]|nr:ADP-ribosylglycohydrolase family protein [Fibrobacteria bacterium]
MLGAIVGDMIGSAYEFAPIKIKDFSLFSSDSRFTDDTVLTVAVAQAILNKGEYLSSVREFGKAYPDAGYGYKFFEWLESHNPEPYNSWGNGSAMRVSPVGLAFDTIEDVLREASRSAEISHNHSEGIKGAQATALSVFLARTTVNKETIKKEITERFDYDLDRSLDDIRPGYDFDVSCQGSVPESIICFLEAESFEDTVRNAVSLGGDADTMACIAGSIAEAYYGGIDTEIVKNVARRLPKEFWKVVQAFYERYGNNLQQH